jgi:Flp pilus assembly protein CpaB
VLSALLAALAVLGLGRFVADRPPAGGVPVVVATTEVAAGTRLGAAVLEVRALPEHALPQGAVADLAEVEGRAATSVLAAGEVVTVHDVGATGLLAAQDPSVRAVFVPVPESAVLGALGPGDRVDLHSPVAGDLVAEDVPVLGVHRGGGGAGGPGAWASGAGADGGGVWLGVGPSTAAALAAARGADPAGGSLLLSLRGPPPDR